MIIGVDLKANIWPGVLAAVLLVLVLAISLQALQTRNSSSLPPGPKSWPLVGFKFRRPYVWRHMEELTHQYGDVCTVMDGNRPLIIVGTVNAALELLERRSGVTADRPRQIMAGEIISGGLRTLILHHNDRWRRVRKMLHSQLQPRVAKTCQPIQEREARRLLLDILNAPDKFREAVDRYAAAVIVKVTYGVQDDVNYHDPDLVAVRRCAANFGRAASPGAYIVDRIPILRFVPWFTSEGRRMHQDELSLFSRQVEAVRARVQLGNARECFTTYMLNKQKEYQLSDPEAAYLAGSLFGAGSDTSASAIQIIIMAAACFPETAAKARDELDRVCGDKRLPTFADKEDLPYLNAFVSEGFRWRPVSSGGFKHAVTQDIVYDKFLIPSGAAILGNHWSIHRDPTYYPEPDMFRPERWLIKKPDGGWAPNKDIRHFTYGFGRRVCAGSHVADRSLFINTANLLHAFDITKKRDANGKEIEIDTLAFTDLANSRPLPFCVTFTPRRQNLKQLIEEMGTKE